MFGDEQQHSLIVDIAMMPGNICARIVGGR